mmetsp:Transcript_33485/g.71768  ORF Transcript_33485/g.71768 Transcript_33485/m.71768 type:complete len:111 (-) Transcript_33485:580-912(-)
MRVTSTKISPGHESLRIEIARKTTNQSNDFVSPAEANHPGGENGESEIEAQGKTKTKNERPWQRNISAAQEVLRRMAWRHRKANSRYNATTWPTCLELFGPDQSNHDKTA